jgi:calcineurin-like phosphoesterase family protein
MKTWLISDTHFNHQNIATYCQRPDNFTELIVRNWQNKVHPNDMVIHVGDVFIGKPDGWRQIYPLLPGRKVLVRGNHDKHPSLWWMENGFDIAIDAMIFRHTWITHRPAQSLPKHTYLNIHGHLHNIWHGFHKDEPDTRVINNQGRLHNRWQRLFAVEYADYGPVEFEDFLAHPDKYQARGPAAEAEADYEAQVFQDEKEAKRKERLANHICKSDKCRCPKAEANRTPEMIAENYSPSPMERD